MAEGEVARGRGAESPGRDLGGLGHGRSWQLGAALLLSSFFFSPPDARAGVRAETCTFLPQIRHALRAWSWSWSRGFSVVARNLAAGAASPAAPSICAARLMVTGPSCSKSSRRFLSRRSEPPLRSGRCRGRPTLRWIVATARHTGRAPVPAHLISTTTPFWIMKYSDGWDHSALTCVPMRCPTIHASRGPGGHLPHRVGGSLGLLKHRDR